MPGGAYQDLGRRRVVPIEQPGGSTTPFVSTPTIVERDGSLRPSPFVPPTSSPTGDRRQTLPPRETLAYNASTSRNHVALSARGPGGSPTHRAGSVYDDDAHEPAHPELEKGLRRRHVTPPRSIQEHHLYLDNATFAMVHARKSQSARLGHRARSASFQAWVRRSIGTKEKQPSSATRGAVADVSASIMPSSPAPWAKISNGSESENTPAIDAVPASRFIAELSGSAEPRSGGLQAAAAALTAAGAPLDVSGVATDEAAPAELQEQGAGVFGWFGSLFTPREPLAPHEPQAGSTPLMPTASAAKGISTSTAAAAQAALAVEDALPEVVLSELAALRQEKAAWLIEREELLARLRMVEAPEAVDVVQHHEAAAGSARPAPPPRARPPAAAAGAPTASRSSSGLLGAAEDVYTS